MICREDLAEKKFTIFICSSQYSKPHTHNFLELAYVLSGEAEHCWDENYAQIKAGDYFVVDYRSEHSYRAKGADFAVINCLFLPELIDASLVHCSSLKAVISNYQIHFKNHFFTANLASSIFQDEGEQIRSLLLKMLKEYRAESPGYLQIIRSKLIEILVLTMRKIYFDPMLETGDSSMEMLLQYINLNYMKPIMLKDVCRRFNYSMPYLSAKFKKELGISYTEYLQKMRVEHSMHLLAHTDKTIDEIAQSVGYHDMKAFYSVFKRVANTTPASFRKNFY